MTATLPAKKSSSLSGLMFCSPWIVGVVLLFAWPFAASLYCSWVWTIILVLLTKSLMDAGPVEPSSTRCITACCRCPFRSCWVCVWQCCCQALFRTLVFLPSIIPIVASSILWVWMLDADSGLVNTLLGWIGFPSQNWLNQARSAVSIEGAAQIGAWFSGGRLLLFGSKDALVLC